VKFQVYCCTRPSEGVTVRLREMAPGPNVFRNYRLLCFCFLILLCEDGAQDFSNFFILSTLNLHNVHSVFAT